jgi:hypothetical protein
VAQRVVALDRGKAETLRPPSDYGPARKVERGRGKSTNWESRKQVRSEKSCVTGGGCPPGLEAKPLEFRTKVMDGKV